MTGVNWKKVEDSKFWKPENPKDSIMGKLTGVSESKNGKIYSLQKADGEVVLLPSHAYLENRLRNIAIDSVIKVEFLGKKATPNGDAFTYDVFVAE